jgi:isopentenyl-diphosphate Delta-isomerase
MGEKTDRAEEKRQIMERKEDHIRICLEKQVQARSVRTLLDDVHLINDSLPEMDLADVDLSTTFLGRKFAAPFMIGAMTGGAELAKRINRNLAEAAQEEGIGMVLGSQRAGLYDSSLAETYSITRKVAPDIFLGANIGGAQIARGFSVKEGKKLVDMIGADALYVHLNPAQEVVQPEGEGEYRNVIKGIRSFVDGLDVPIVAKEVGFGVSGLVSKELEEIGVGAIEVAGAGGTSYAAVEYYRAKDTDMRMKQTMGDLFWDWGIPTAAAVYRAKKAVKIPIVSSGGIRTGLDMAKSMALGASMSAVALPLLKPATVSAEAVREKLEELKYGLKVAMFLTGCGKVSELYDVKKVVTGKLKEWMEQA